MLNEGVAKGDYFNHFPQENTSILHFAFCILHFGRQPDKLESDALMQHLVIFRKFIVYILCFDKFLAKSVVLCCCDRSAGLRYNNEFPL